MLRNIKIRNFCSIGKEQEMSLEITSKDILDDSARETHDGKGINLVSCIVGHNASGKTTILKAISFLFWFIENSYTSQKSDQKIPMDPHRLRLTEPTRIEIEFFEKKTHYNYFIEFNETQIIHEWLGKKELRSFSRVFELERKDNEATIKRGQTLKINETDETRFKERRNVSVLSSLINTGYLPDITFFKRFQSNVSQHGLVDSNFLSCALDASKALFENESLREEVLNFSRDIDLGISNFKFLEVPGPSKIVETPEATNKIPVLNCTHSSETGKFDLLILEESNGTQRSFTILSEVLPLLKTGGLAVLDEIESGLHPYVAKKIISLFENKKTNPYGAQLIFSTHQHILLGDRTKTQIFIAEKNSKTFETEVYRLDDVEGVRNDENYFHKYIAGAYGGTPKITWL